jgi:hypothetical protein
MRCSEITAQPLTDEIKPKTPDQQRLINLKKNKERAVKQLKDERARQQIRKAQSTLTPPNHTAARSF